ncbi:MAG: hypothetical protein P1U40_00275 [Coxiellaceae bacterium]|nr:hypothetical protein [Coxiellaceae bacterium]
MTRRKRAKAAIPNPYTSEKAKDNASAVQQYALAHPDELTVYKNDINGFLLLKFTVADRPETWYLNPGADKINKSQANAKPRFFLASLLRNGSLLDCPDTELAAVEATTQPAPLVTARPRKRQAIASAGASAKPQSKPLTQEPSPTDQELSLSKAQQEEFPKYVAKWKSLVPNVEDILKHNLLMIQDSPRGGLTYTATERQGITYYSIIKEGKRTILSLRPDYKLTKEDCEDHGVVAEDPITYFFSKGAIPARKADMKRTLQGFSCPKSTRWKDGSIAIKEFNSNSNRTRATARNTMAITILLPLDVKKNITIKLDPITDPKADSRRLDDILRSLINLYKEEINTTTKLEARDKLKSKDLIDKLIKKAVDRKLIQIIGHRSKQYKKKRRIEPSTETPTEQIDHEMDYDSNPALAEPWDFDTEFPDGVFAPPMSTMAAPEDISAPPVSPPASPLAALAQAAAGSGQNLQMDLADEELFAFPMEPATAAGQSLNIAKKTDALVMHWGEQHRATIAKNLQVILNQGKDRVQIDFDSAPDVLVLKPIMPSTGSQQKINLIPIAPIPDVDSIFNQQFNKTRKMLIKLNCAVTKSGNPRHYTHGISCSAHTKDYQEISVAAFNVTNEADFLAGKVRIRLTFIGKEGIDIIANGNINDAIHIQRGFIRYYMQHKALMKTLAGTDALNFCFTYATQCPWLSNPSKVERLATVTPISRKRTREDSKDDDIAAELLAAPTDEVQLGGELSLLLGSPSLPEDLDKMIAALDGLDEPPKASSPAQVASAPVKVANNPSSFWMDISQLREKPRAATTAFDDSMEDENIDAEESQVERFGKVT